MFAWRCIVCRQGSSPHSIAARLLSSTNKPSNNWRTAPLQRHSLLRGALQNTQVPTGVRWKVRLNQGPPCFLPTVPRLIQPRAPPFGYRLFTRRRMCPLVEPARASSSDSACCKRPMRRTRTLRPPDIRTTSPAWHSLDQQTRGGSASTVIAQPIGRIEHPGSWSPTPRERLTARSRRARSTSEQTATPRRHRYRRNQRHRQSHLCGARLR